MKCKIIIKTLAAFTLIFMACASTSTGNVTGLSLTDAIEQTGEKIASELPKGSRVAIVAFESANDNISDYIMEELTGALFDRKIEVADRQNLEYVYKELNLQMSGDVSDESAKSIGKFLAADMVITGQLLDLDGMYRYRTSAINVETAVRASVTRLDVKSDTKTRRMMTALANQKTTVKVAKYGVSADTKPQTAGTFLDRGILFASRGDYDMAIADFTEAIKLDPNMSAAYVLRGMAYADKKDYDRAIVEYNQALKINPNNANAYSSRGSAYLYKNDYNNAIADFTQMIRLEPNLWFGYYFRGLSYKDINKYDLAIADFSQMIRVDPNNPLAYNERGDIYLQTGDFDRVIADYTEVMRISPNWVISYINRGVAYVTKGDFDRAIADYTQAIRIAPNDADAHYFRGQTYLYGKRDYDRAIADFETCLRLDPNNASAHKMLDEARRAKGR